MRVDEFEGSETGTKGRVFTPLGIAYGLARVSVYGGRERSEISEEFLLLLSLLSSLWSPASED